MLPGQLSNIKIHPNIEPLPPGEVLARGFGELVRDVEHGVIVQLKIGRHLKQLRRRVQFFECQAFHGLLPLALLLPGFAPVVEQVD